MTNSDNGTSAPAAHQPGDRVRIRHNPAQNAGYSAEQNRARQALDGQIGSIRERTVTNAYRVAPPGSTERGAWFEADELEPVAADSLPAGDAPRAAPDPLALASRQAEEAFRAADRWRAEYQTAKDELGAARLALGVAQREAEDARQEAREAKERLGAAEAERDALRGKLGAAEAMLRAEEGSRVAWRNEALREQGERKVAEARLAAVVQAWGRMRALLLGLHRPLGAVWLDALEAVDAALGGAVAKPERECCWEQTVEQRVSEIEARLGRLEAMGTGMGTEATARARASRSNEGANR